MWCETSRPGGPCAGARKLCHVLEMRMNLNALLPIVRSSLPFSRMSSRIRGENGPISAIDATKPPLLAALHEEASLPILVVARNIRRAKQLCEEIGFWVPSGTPVFLFPELDVLPYERLTPDAAIVQQRLRSLAALRGWTAMHSIPPPIVVASAHAIAQPTIPPDQFGSACRSLRPGMTCDPSHLVAELAGLGYEVGQVVESPGRVSRRGGIVDIFSPSDEFPARLEFFGNEIDSIRRFDPTTQRSTALTDEVTVIPTREMLLPDQRTLDDIFGALDMSNCSREAVDGLREDWEALSSARWREDLQFYAPLLAGGSIVDYLPSQSVLVLDGESDVAAELSGLDSQAAELRLGQVERGDLPRNFPRPYLVWSELESKFERIEYRASLEDWANEGSDALDFGVPPVYQGQISRLIDYAGKALGSGTRLILVSQQADRISELLRERNIVATPVSEIEGLPAEGTATLVHGSLGGGWTLDRTVLLTDAEIFGLAKQRRPQPKRRAEREVFAADLSIGDYVVHVDHGIAHFLGLTTMTSNGSEREYLILEYAEDDRLYVPTDQVDRVARYVGSGGGVPSLSRLNTQEWARTKQRVKRATAEMAHELLGIYAAREVAKGIAFAGDTLWEQELEASFPYEETPDQVMTIRDVKADMESARPMDRLVCGDVGYGKTEVAIRAAFKAVNNGMQVAVLVPTTVLAQQHFMTFSERLAAFPMRIEVLSRFRSPREQQSVIEGLANGSVDICIGTHRLIQQDVRFKNLGLVVIDEEQKFGVAHKERLKRLRSEVDVLTLSATPIPRSLHMSLVGVRDMSTMETAPEDRLPIKTYVAEYGDELVRDAILREMDRGGQVFFVHNRVQSIAYVAEQLRALVPEARIGVGHGQMPEDALESVMLDFAGGRLDVLVCTTIIESGLDLPSANTLIVNHADRLGLTQLYHLRGRVGRGDVRAYAYLLYEKGKRLTEIAQQRLKTIFEATELGAGFRIAMKDLEIRGAGNILGPEQSGHMSAVGFDLYCRLLAQAVEELRAGQTGPVAPAELPGVDLPLAAHIPVDYVGDLNVRLALYQRLSKVDSLEQLRDVEGELKDRFGEVPADVRNLLYIMRIKVLAAQAGIRKISTEDKQVVLALENAASPELDSVLRGFGRSVRIGRTRVRLDMRQLGLHWQKMLEQVLRAIAAKRQVPGSTSA